MTDKALKAVDGTYLPGESGNKLGRPLGSKNKVTLYKIMAEEAFRERNMEKINRVLDDIVEEALQGNKQAMKMVWDASISKANFTEDKNVASKQQITVHRMSVVQSPEEDKDE